MRGVGARRVREHEGLAGGQRAALRHGGARARRGWRVAVGAPQLPAADVHRGARDIADLDDVVVTAARRRGRQPGRSRPRSPRARPVLRRRQRRAPPTRARRDGISRVGVLSEGNPKDSAQPYRCTGRMGDGLVTRPAWRRATSACPRTDIVVNDSPTSGRARRAARTVPSRSVRTTRRHGACSAAQRRRRRVAVRVALADLDRRDPRPEPRAAAPAAPGRRCRGGRPSARRPARARAAPAPWLSASAVSSTESAVRLQAGDERVVVRVPGRAPARRARRRPQHLEAQAPERDHLARRRARGCAARATRACRCTGDGQPGAAVDHQPRRVARGSRPRRRPRGRSRRG